MIEKSELRYGSWVNYEGPGQVNFKFFDVLYIGNYKDFDPIPLTPEILEGCGFKKDRNGWQLPKTQFSITEQFYPCWLDKMLWPQDIQDFKNSSLRHLHQLQNLISVLTGEELTIKRFAN